MNLKTQQGRTRIVVLAFFAMNTAATIWGSDEMITQTLKISTAVLLCFLLFDYVMAELFNLVTGLAIAIRNRKAKKQARQEDADWATLIEIQDKADPVMLVDSIPHAVPFWPVSQLADGQEILRRPGPNYYDTMRQRIAAAWWILRGRAIAVTYAEDVPGFDYIKHKPKNVKK